MIENCKIRSAFLGYEGHGILTIQLTVEGEGWGQSFGGYRLDGPHGDSAHCGFWVRRILETLELGSWEKVAGQLIRIDRGSDGRIQGIGHFYKDKWFYPAKEKI